MAGSLRERVPAASVRRVRLLRVDLRAHRVEREGLGGVNIPHVKGSTGQFHEKMGASFYHPNRQNPAVSCLMFLSPVCGARRRHHSTNGVLDNGHVECVEACAFFRGPNKSKIAPKWGFEPIFSSHRGSILSRRAWRVAPAAA